MNRLKIGGVWVDLDNLKARVNLIDVLGVDNVLCPWHEDKNPSLHVYHDHVHCFSCGMSADGVTYLQKANDLSFRQAVVCLQAFEQRRLVRPADVVLDPIPLAEATKYHRMLEELRATHYARRWLAARGLRYPVLKEALIGWDGLFIIIPHIANGQLLNIKYRAHPRNQKQGDPKYTSIKGRKLQHLYPWDYYRREHNGDPILFLTEGEFDALILLQAGLPALALPSGVGTPWRPWLPFFRQRAHIFLLYDMDKAGDKAAASVQNVQGKLGTSLLQLLAPTSIQHLTWDPSRGKDVTEARRVLIPKLRRVYAQVV